MFIDSNNLFGEKQAVGAAATVASTNVIDLGAKRDIGAGMQLYIYALVTTAIGAGGKITISLQEASDSDFTADVSTIQEVGVFSASAKVGSEIAAIIQPFVVTERYIRLAYVRSSATTGNITAFLTNTINAVTDYKSGFTIK